MGRVAVAPLGRHLEGVTVGVATVTPQEPPPEPPVAVRTWRPPSDAVRAPPPEGVAGAPCPEPRPRPRRPRLTTSAPTVPGREGATASVTVGVAAEAMATREGKDLRFLLIVPSLKAVLA